MCGIAGIHGIENSQMLVKQMLEKIKHRGPDDDGVYSKRLTAIGMNRLRIRSQEKDSVPFKISQDCYAAFNGEVYAKHSINFDQHELIEGGAEEAQTVFNNDSGFITDGMYALAVANDEDKLMLFRDRYGIKPLYYRYTNNQLYFCSEVSPLLDFNFGNKTLCRNVLDQILLLGHPIVSGKTVFREIQSLKPGECLIQDKSASTLLHKHNFKHYQFPNIKENQQRLHQQLRNMIQKSVKECTLSNRHIGLALSGGVDSSILAWELNALGIENVTTISVIYVGSSDGIKTLKKLELPPGGVWEKWQHVVVPFDEQDFKRCLCEAIEASALPITLSSYALYFKLAKFAKEAGITVLLSGEGADEIFSGYTSYAVWSKKTKNQLHEDKLRAFYLNDEKIELWKSLLGQERILNVLADFKNSIKYKNETPIKVLLTHELHYSLEPLLIRTDLALMRYSIEGRVPFLHCGIPELLNQLPVEAFFNEAETKPLLRKLYPEYSRLTKIPKTPFRITEKIYLSKEIQEWFRKTLHDNISFLDALKIDFQPLFEKLISRDISPIDFDALFKLVCLVLWQKSHCVNLERTL